MHRELKIVFVEPSTLMFSPCAPYYPANSPPATKFIFLECIFQQPVSVVFLARGFSVTVGS